jgi:hypothetical protein
MWLKVQPSIDSEIEQSNNGAPRTGLEYALNDKGIF